MTEPWLTVAAVARRLGVAPATLRTWDRRYGIGPSGHAPGRHRRYSPEDMGRLELMQPRAGAGGLTRPTRPGTPVRWRCPAPPPIPWSGCAPSRTRGRPTLPRRMPRRAGRGTGRYAPPDAALPDAASRTAAAGRRNRQTATGGPEPTSPTRARRRPGPAPAGCRAAAPTAWAGPPSHSTPSPSAPCSTSRSRRHGLAATWNEVARPVLDRRGAALGLDRRRGRDRAPGQRVRHRGVRGQCRGRPATARRAAGAPGRHARRAARAAAGRAGGGARRGAAWPAGCSARTCPPTRWSPRSGGPRPPRSCCGPSSGATADVDVLRFLPRTRPRFRTFVAGPGWADADLPARTGCSTRWPRRARPSAPRCRSERHCSVRLPHHPHGECHSAQPPEWRAQIRALIVSR